jgi:hypothetical protein
VGVRLAADYMHYDIVEGFVSGYAAALVRMF